MLQQNVLQRKKSEKFNYRISKDIVFTNGVFDILHKGHIDLFKFCNKIGKKVILGINTDKSVKLNKGNKRPINKLSKRIREIKKIKLISKIIIFSNKTPLKIIKKIKPDVIIKGEDYKFNEVSGSKIFNTILFKKKNNLSTTKLIRKIK